MHRTAWRSLRVAMSPSSLPHGAAGSAITSSPKAMLVLLGILLAGAGFRLWDLAGPSLWVDELYSVSFGQMPQRLLWSDWMLRETNPPLFYSVLHGWMSIFGQSEFAARSLSALFGAASIAAAFFLARRLHSTNAGLLAALFMAVSSQQLQYSQQVRGYALGFFAAALAIYALVRLTDRWLAGPSTHRQGWPELALYAGAGSVAFYTHTTFFLLPLLANLYVVWLWVFRTPRRWKDAAGWVAANLVLLAVCSWWLWITFLQVTSETGAEPISWIEQPSIREAAVKAAHIFATRNLDALNYLTGAVFGGLIAWGVWKLPMERRVLMAMFGVGVPALLYLIGFKQPVFLERTLFWTQVVYFPCLAVGLLSLPVGRWRWAAVAACAALLLVDAVVWRAVWYREPWREIGEVVAERAGPRDALLGYSPDAIVNLRFYCDGRCAEIRKLAVRASDKSVLIDGFEGVVVDPSNLREAVAGVERIWAVHRDVTTDPALILGEVAELEASDVLTTDPIRDERNPTRNDMRLSVWRVKPAN